MLSGWSTKGYLACPVCMSSTSSTHLRHSKKICYMGHRRFLSLSHPWRIDKKNFDGKVEFREPVIPESGHVIAHSLQMVGNEPYFFGKSSEQVKLRKRKRDDVRSNWCKRSVFFDLPYWADLKLRHNIDIMHVVKNVTESVVATLFDIKGKTKDTWKSRRDLMEFGLKRDLHLIPQEKSFTMPMACYHFTKDEKKKVLDFLQKIKFPDGLVSNMSRCIKKGEFQLSGMKSHDFYVFIQRVLPVAVWGLLTKKVRQVLFELSEFFKKLCSKNSNKEVLEKESMNIAVLLCKMERLFPPSFFDVMMHLMVHLPHEAIIAGPAEYRWMFPFER